MNYRDALLYIKDLEGLGSRPGTETIRELAKRLGNPQNSLKVVHIAGTNGKGSVSSFLDSILRTAQIKTGRYISPAIFTYLERFQTDGEYMTEEEFCDIMEMVISVCDDMVRDGYERPTAFETETVVAFIYFLRKKVDIVLLETGMGGREDATNILEKPLCTILTSISMDHMNFLGNSLSEILNEKMGIMREGVPCISYEMNSELKKQWVKKCDDLQCEGIMHCKDDVEIIDEDLRGSDIRYKDDKYHIALAGEYQADNAALAIETAWLLRSLPNESFDLKNESIRRGLENTCWPGRFQLLNHGGKIPVIADGAHNEGGWLALKDNIESLLKGYKLIYVCGVLADKEYEKMIKILSPYSDIFIAFTPDNRRALDGRLLMETAEGYFDNLFVEDDVIDAVKRAEETASGMEGTAILVFGSLSFMGQLIESFGGIV